MRPGFFHNDTDHDADAMRFPAPSLTRSGNADVDTLSFPPPSLTISSDVDDGTAPSPAPMTFQTTQTVNTEANDTNDESGILGRISNAFYNLTTFYSTEADSSPVTFHPDSIGGPGELSRDINRYSPDADDAYTYLPQGSHGYGDSNSYVFPEITASEGRRIGGPNGFNEGNPENTMNAIVHTTARSSETRMRELVNFPSSAADSSEEDTLIQVLIEALQRRQQALEVDSNQLSPHQNIRVALRVLAAGDSWYRNNNQPSFTNLNGYGMRNVLALYVKAIMQKDSPFFEKGVTLNDAIDAIAAGIANGARGNNRNNEDGIDNENDQDYPVCGKGHYNALASALVSILKPVNIIYDIDSYVRTFLAQIVMATMFDFCKQDEKWTTDLTKEWAEVDPDTLKDFEGNEASNHYKKFLNRFKEIINTKAFEDRVDQYLAKEFAWNPSLQGEIKTEILEKLPAAFKGGLFEFLNTINLDRNAFKAFLERFTPFQVLNGEQVDGMDQIFIPGAGRNCTFIAALAGVIQHNMQNPIQQIDMHTIQDHHQLRAEVVRRYRETVRAPTDHFRLFQQLRHAAENAIRDGDIPPSNIHGLTDLERYINWIEQSGTLGGDLELRTIATIFNIRIVNHAAGHIAPQIYTSFEPRAGIISSIHVRHRNSHYNVLVQQGTWQNFGDDLPLVQACRVGDKKSTISVSSSGDSNASHSLLSRLSLTTNRRGHSQLAQQSRVTSSSLIGLVVSGNHLSRERSETRDLDDKVADIINWSKFT